MSDDSSLTGRMRRYARVSTAMGGLAARLAGERYLGLPLDRARHANDLRAALGGIKGPLMKVAQLLATIPEALPEDYARELVTLQADAPAMGWNFVKRRMAGELGPDWEKKFGKLRARGGACRVARPGASRDGQGRHRACLQAAISRHGFGGGGRSAPVEADPVALRALGPRTVDRGNPRRDRRTPARGTGLYARGGASAPLSRHPQGRETW